MKDQQSRPHLKGEKRLKGEKARAGEVRHEVRYILYASLVLVIVAFVAISVWR